MSQPSSANAQRHLELIPCDPTQAQALSRQFTDSLSGSCLVIDQSNPKALAHARQALGLEARWVVINLHSQGLEPDQIAAASGCVLGGGRLILLAAELPLWPRWQDAMSARIQAHGYQSQHSPYRQRLANLLRSSAPLASTSALPLPSRLDRPSDQSTLEPTAEQALCVEQLLEQQRQRQLSCLCAARGRGKSTVLALSLLKLYQQRSSRSEAISLLLSAPSKRAITPLLQQLGRLLASPATLPAVQQRLAVHQLKLTFCPPDQLPTHAANADWIVVEEASSIDIHLLDTLVGLQRPCCFCGTQAGYEGTANAFTIQAQRRWPHAQWLKLTRALRFANNDPLERWIEQALMPSSTLTFKRPHHHGYQRLSSEELLADEPTLAAIYQLLISAHYDTKPNDLRQLLDGENLAVHVIWQAGELVAVALVASEGPLPPHLHQAIVHGQRRPRGHLLPQVLAYQQGFVEALSARYWRVVRIAVMPKWQNQGIGSQLLNELQQQATAAGVAYLGASFGARADTFRFWRAQGFLPVHLGLTRNAVSGSVALSVLQALNAEALTPLQHWQQWFAHQFSILKGLVEPLDKAALFDQIERITPAAQALSANELRRRVQHFLQAEHGLEQCAAALVQLGLNASETPYCYQRLVQQQSWDTLRAHTGQSQAALLAIMRAEIKKNRPLP